VNGSKSGGIGRVAACSSAAGRSCVGSAGDPLLPLERAVAFAFSLATLCGGTKLLLLLGRGSLDLASLRRLAARLVLAVRAEAAPSACGLLVACPRCPAGGATFSLPAPFAEFLHILCRNSRFFLFQQLRQSGALLLQLEPRQFGPHQVLGDLDNLGVEALCRS
jgi:hypothetical protein